MRVFAFVATLALAGCASHPFTLKALHDAPLPVPVSVTKPAQKPVPVTVTKHVCLQLPEWSDADWKALHEALARGPNRPIVLRAVLDWNRYYIAAKACKES